MTIDHQNVPFDQTSLIRTARHCIRAYCDLLHGSGIKTVDLSPLSAVELAVLQEMVREMFDSYRLIDASNCLLFIDDEIKRRREVVASGEQSL